jgi:hypothetical protein
MKIAFDLSIPPVTPKKWNRIFASLNPLFAPLVILIAIPGKFSH